MSPTEHHDAHEAAHKVEYPAIASLEDMKLHRLPLNYRDLCSKCVRCDRRPACSRRRAELPVWS